MKYINTHTKIEIICSLHGSFYQSPKNHLSGSNCPNCGVKVSKPEQDIVEYIRSIYDGVILQSYRPEWLKGKELDIYIPEHNLAIEYNGSSYHHSSKSSFVRPFYLNKAKERKYHFNKWEDCFNNNVTLLSIYDFYWISKKEHYLSKIKHYLNLDTKVYARKCTISEITNSVAYKFYEENHIEGVGFNYKDPKSFALIHNNNIIMCCTIGGLYNQSTKSFKLKLHRISTLKGITVVGGISRLSSFLKKNFGEFSYQITLSSGGSTLKHYKYKIIDPRYFWVNPDKKEEYYHRNYCQKHLLEKHFKEPVLKEDTENTYMERLGFLKIYDNGLAEIQIE